jgi:hypothetical protein
MAVVADDQLRVDLAGASQQAEDCQKNQFLHNNKFLVFNNNDVCCFSKNADFIEEIGCRHSISK